MLPQQDHTPQRDFIQLLQLPAMFNLPILAVLGLAELLQYSHFPIGFDQRLSAPLYFLFYLPTLRRQLLGLGAQQQFVAVRVQQMINDHAARLRGLLRCPSRALNPPLNFFDLLLQYLVGPIRMGQLLAAAITLRSAQLQQRQ